MPYPSSAINPGLSQSDSRRLNPSLPEPIAGMLSPVILVERSAFRTAGQTKIEGVAVTVPFGSIRGSGMYPLLTSTRGHSSSYHPLAFVVVFVGLFGAFSHSSVGQNTPPLAAEYCTTACSIYPRVDW